MTVRLLREAFFPVRTRVPAPILVRPAPATSPEIVVVLPEPCTSKVPLPETTLVDTVTEAFVRSVPPFRKRWAATFWSTARMPELTARAELLVPMKVTLLVSKVPPRTVRPVKALPESIVKREGACMVVTVPPLFETEGRLTVKVMVCGVLKSVPKLMVSLLAEPVPLTPVRTVLRLPADASPLFWMTEKVLSALTSLRAKAERQRREKKRFQERDEGMGYPYLVERRGPRGAG